MKNKYFRGYKPKKENRTRHPDYADKHGGKTRGKVREWKKTVSPDDYIQRKSLLGGVAEIARRVVRKEKVYRFMVRSIADEQEVLEFFTSIMRGESPYPDDSEKAGKCASVGEMLQAASRLQSAYEEAKKVQYGGRHSVLLELIQDDSVRTGGTSFITEANPVGMLQAPDAAEEMEARILAMEENNPVCDELCGDEEFVNDDY